MKTPAPLVLVLWLMKDAAVSDQRLVTAAYGQSVTVPCPYDQRFRDSTKYWCRGAIYELCSIVVKTPRNQGRDRFSITDDKAAGVFTVTMMSLTDGDSDRYWCVVARHGRNVHTAVRLLVTHAGTSADTPTPTDPARTRDEWRCWDTLRWILFVLMLSCVLSTHVSRRIKAAVKNMAPTDT